MLLVDTLDDIDFETGGGCALEAFVESPYSDNGMANGRNYVRFLEDESSPEACIEEA